MKMMMLLMMAHDNQAAIPLEEVRTVYFPHLSMPKLMRKLASGEIPLPITQAEKSQKSARYVLIQHLAEYLEKIAEEAESEMKFKMG